MNPLAWEAQLEAFLKAQFPDLEVQAFPDDWEAYSFIHPVGAILLRYHGSKFGEPTDTSGAMFQARRPTFALTVFSRDLRSHQGAYQVLEDLRQKLTGYRLAGAEGLFPLDEFFIRQEEGSKWVYGALYAMRSRAMRATPLDDELPAPVLKNLALKGGW